MASLADFSAGDQPGRRPIVRTADVFGKKIPSLEDLRGVFSRDGDGFSIGQLRAIR
jgi:hypothetical protein